MGVLEEAVRDAKELEKATMERAKSALVEMMAPKIKEMVSAQLGEEEIPEVKLEMDGLTEEPEPELEGMEPQEEAVEGVDETVQLSEDPGLDQNSAFEAYEAADQMAVSEAGKKKKAKKAPPKEKRVDDEDEDDLGDLSVAPEGEVEDEEPEPVDEVVEVTNEDLEEALSEALKEVKVKLQKEAKVTKSFGEPADATLKASGGRGEKGIADEKSGEHYWNDEKPPAAKDWTVKEAKYRKYIAVLSEQLSEYKGAYGKLLTTLKEVNLFNAKLLYTNKVLQNSSLSNKHKLSIVEMFDSAKSRRDVELIYSSLDKSFKIAGMVNESSRKLQRASRSAPPVLREDSLRKGLKAGTNGDDEDEVQTMTEQWQHLAGLKQVLKD